MTTVGIVVDVAQGDEAHYRVSVHQQASHGFVEATSALVDRPLPVPVGAVGELLDSLREALQADYADVQALGELGQHLWDVVFAGDVGSRWTSLSGDRTLLDIRVRELEGLPWELLQQGPRIMFTVVDRPFVRARLDAAPQPLFEPPLRVLVVVGQREDDSLHWREEVQALEVLCARQPERFHVEVLVEPDKQLLRTSCEELRPQVLHVIAHGQFSGKKPVVTIANWQIDPNYVVNGLQVTIPVVVLNACHTGTSDALDSSLGLGAAFRGNRSVATLCMQGAIRGTAAAVFSTAFYSGLLAGKAIDAASVDGRIAITDEHDDGADRWLPLLELAMAPGPLLDAPALPIPAVPLGAIDRSRERRRLLFAMAPIKAATKRKPAAIVRGEPGSGKTWLAQGLGHVFRCKGGLVRYANLSGTRSVPWFQVLRAIRGGAGSTVAGFDELPGALFSHFNDGLNRVAGGDAPAMEAPTELVPDQDAEIGAVSERTLDHITALFGLFRTALKRAAEGNRLLVIVDHLERVNADDLRNHLVPKLFIPVANDEVTGVHLILVAQPSALDPLRDQGLGSLAEDVLVDAPPWVDFRRFASVYRDLNSALGECGEQCRQQFDEYVDGTAKHDPWKLRMLHNLMIAAKDSTDG